MNQRGNLALYVSLIVVGAVLVLGLGVGIRYYTKKQEKPAPENKQTQLTQPSKSEEPKPVVEDETKDWKVYRNDTYSFEFKYPPYLTLKKETVDTIPLIRGSRLEHYSFKFSPDPENAFWGSFSIYDVNNFSVYSSSEYSWAFYDLSTSKWYTSGEANIGADNPSRIKKKEYLPFINSKTLSGVPIYNGFGYEDVGVYSSHRLIFVPNNSIVIDFLEGSDGNALDFGSKEVQELSQKFPNNLQTIIQSTKFTR